MTRLNTFSSLGIYIFTAYDQHSSFWLNTSIFENSQRKQKGNTYSQTAQVTKDYVHMEKYLQNDALRVRER